MQEAHRRITRKADLVVSRVASLEVETDKAADSILDVSGVTESPQVCMRPSLSSATGEIHFHILYGCE